MVLFDVAINTVFGSHHLGKSFYHLVIKFFFSFKLLSKRLDFSADLPDRVVRSGKGLPEFVIGVNLWECWSLNEESLSLIFFGFAFNVHRFGIGGFSLLIVHAASVDHLGAFTLLWFRRGRNGFTLFIRDSLGCSQLCLVFRNLFEEGRWILYLVDQEPVNMIELWVCLLRLAICHGVPDWTESFELSNDLESRLLLWDVLVGWVLLSRKDFERCFIHISLFRLSWLENLPI